MAIPSLRVRRGKRRRVWIDDAQRAVLSHEEDEARWILRYYESGLFQELLRPEGADSHPYPNDSHISWLNGALSLIRPKLFLGDHSAISLLSRRVEKGSESGILYSVVMCR